MILRQLSKTITERATKMPVISVTGPRQSGKTTLVKQLFPEYKYVSLENILSRDNAKADPLDFLKRNGPNLIIDEAQYVPELFSYIQVLVDESGKMGEYILTGSQHFLLMESVSQSLAGRVAIFNLLPFSIQELSDANLLSEDYASHLWKGFYPVLYDRDLKPTEWLPEYVETYVERDLRQIINVNDLSAFRNFLRLCAGHVGQLVNFSSFGNQIGISYNTVKKWLSVLETSFVIFRLEPHHANYNKRLVRNCISTMWDWHVPF
jgi:predicted AAA+ superfamily ATPase